MLLQDSQLSILSFFKQMIIRLLQYSSRNFKNNNYIQFKF